MKKTFLFIVVVFCIDHYVIAMEQENFLLIGKDCQVSIPLNVVKTSEKLELSPQNINRCFFPNADENDLMNIRDCLGVNVIINKMPCSVGKAAYDVAQNYADRVVKELSVQQLVKLSNNINVLFENAIPEHLVRSIFQKVKQCKDHVGFFELPISVKNALCDRLLKEIWYKKDEQGSFVFSSHITNFFSPYSKFFNQLTFLTSYLKSPTMFLPKIVKPCIYVGNKITALLSGLEYQGNSFCNYQLILYINGVTQSFTLQEGPDTDFDINTAFANKDESYFVCMYKNIIDDSNKGLFIVDTKNNTSKKIPYSYIACCFGSNNEIYGFGQNDSVGVLNVETGKITSFSCATRLVGSLEKFKNIRGILNYKNPHEFIIYTDHNLFYATRESDVSTEFILKPCSYQFDHPRVITNVVIDPMGLKLCIETRNKKNNGLDSARDIFLLDIGVVPRSHNIPLKKVRGKSFISFSSGGNLLIISSCENDKAKYTFVDTNTQKSWCKWSDNEVLQCSAGKSIELKNNALTCEIHCVTLVDNNMQEAFDLLTKKDFVMQHPFDILLPTISCLEKSPMNMVDSNLPLPIKNILEAHSQDGKKVSKQTVSYPLIVWNKISGMLSYSRLFFDTIVIAVLAKYLNIHKIISF